MVDIAEFRLGALCRERLRGAVVSCPFDSASIWVIQHGELGGVLNATSVCCCTSCCWCSIAGSRCEIFPFKTCRYRTARFHSMVVELFTNDGIPDWGENSAIPSHPSRVTPAARADAVPLPYVVHATVQQHAVPRFQQQMQRMRMRILTIAKNCEAFVCVHWLPSLNVLLALHGRCVPCGPQQRGY